MTNVGIIGLGFMGLTHLRTYEKNPRARIVAVADQVKKRLEGDLSDVQGNTMGPGEKYDFSRMRTYETVDGILDDSEVELVSICLPTFTHAEITRKALARGKHVLCEKPMALTAADVDAMVEAAGASEGRLMVAQCIRFWPDYARAREIIRSGAVGQVRGARFERRSAFPTWGGWLGDESRSGGAIVDLSIHDIDFAHHLLGVPDRLRAEGHVNLDRTYDYYQGTLRFGDVPVSIGGAWYHQGEYPFSCSFDILCDDATLSFSSATERRLTVFHADGRKEEPTLAAGDGYEHEIAYFLDCLEKSRDPEVSPPEESATSVKLALLLRDSRARGGVEIDVAASLGRGG